MRREACRPAGPLFWSHAGAEAEPANPRRVCVRVCVCACMCAFCFLTHHRRSTGFESRGTRVQILALPLNGGRRSISLAELRFLCLQSGNHRPHSAEDGVVPTGQGGETAHTRSKAADATAAIVISLTAASGHQRPLLTHGPPVERAHEGEDAVVRAAGGLGARNRGHQS